MKRIGSFESKRWGRAVALAATYGGPSGPLAVPLQLSNGEPLAVLSVNMYLPDCSRDSRDLPADCFYVKEWGENEELAAEALASGLFKLRDDLPEASSGFINAPVWQIVQQVQA
jgi:hypothetical protein